MALKKIRVLGDPVLREKSSPVKKIDENIQSLIKDMQDSIHAGYQPGVGLAAPQIGVSKRVIVVNYDGTFEAYINPELEILESSSQMQEEGCLSLPNLRTEVNRPKKVLLKALKMDGSKIEMEAEEMMARILQHEVDHLDGLLFIDRVDKKTKRQLMLEYSQLESEEDLRK